MGVVTEMKTTEVMTNRGNHSADSSIIGGLCTKIREAPPVYVLLDTQFVMLIMLVEGNRVTGTPAVDS